MSSEDELDLSHLERPPTAKLAVISAPGETEELEETLQRYKDYRPRPYHRGLDSFGAWRKSGQRAAVDAAAPSWPAGLSRDVLPEADAEIKEAAETVSLSEYNALKAEYEQLQREFETFRSDQALRQEVMHKEQAAIELRCRRMEKQLSKLVVEERVAPEPLQVLREKRQELEDRAVALLKGKRSGARLPFAAKTTHLLGKAPAVTSVLRQKAHETDAHKRSVERPPRLRIPSHSPRSAAARHRVDRIHTSPARLPQPPAPDSARSTGSATSLGSAGSAGSTDMFTSQLVTLRKENELLRQENHALRFPGLKDAPKDWIWAKDRNEKSGYKPWQPVLFERKDPPVNEQVAKRDLEIVRLRSLLERERRSVLRLREQMLRYMGKRGELEKFIKAAMDDVARKRAEAERMSARAAARKERVVIERDLRGHRKLRSVRVEDMTEKERQDAVDVLLAEQRVIQILYEKSFKSFDGDKADDVVRDDLGGMSLAAAIKEDRNLVQSMWAHFPISYVSDDEQDTRVRRRLRRRMDRRKNEMMRKIAGVEHADRDESSSSGSISDPGDGSASDGAASSLGSTAALGLSPRSSIDGEDE